MTVLCITPNMSVDRTMVVPGFRAGGVWRTRSVKATCGGKGVNVARALRRLGQRAHCAGFLAGDTGRRAAGYAAELDLDGRWTWVDGETRTTSIIVGDDGATTVINEPGMTVTEDDWGRFVVDAQRAAADVDSIGIAGSMPPGCPRGGLRDLIAAVTQSGSHPVWVDTSGGALEQAVASKPFGIKVNGDEIAGLLGRTVRSIKDAAGAARFLCERGIGRVAVTLGSEGAILMVQGDAWCARAPGVDVANVLGSGDCFLAGVIAAGLQGTEPGECLRLAVACGTANALALDVAGWPSDALAGIATATEVHAISGA